MADSSANSDSGQYCIECGEPLTRRDRFLTTCPNCRSVVGKAADLDIAIRASGDDPDRIRAWSEIQYLLRKRFGENLSNEDLWQRLRQFLKTERGLESEDFLRLPLDQIKWLLTGDRKGTRPIPVNDRMTAELASNLETAKERTALEPLPGETRELATFEPQRQMTPIPPETPACHITPRQPEPAKVPTHSPFTGGKMIFYSDRVELCRVDICSGPRSERYRRTLELLAEKNRNGAFTSYNGEALAKAVGISPGEKDMRKRGRNAAGLIKDLRGRISKALRSQANLECGKSDVILSGGPGYRLSDRLSVHQEGQSDKADIGDTDGNRDGPNADGALNGVPNGVPNAGNNDVHNDPENTPAGRQKWIVEQLTEGHKLKAVAVAKQFGCSRRTAKRDLQSLKDERVIEFEGAPRSGHYRLPKAAGADK
jgi:hypothetical protein